MADSWTITGGEALVAGALLPRPVHIAEGRIAADSTAGARTFDASGLLVLPGIVDIHGDGFERQVMPRPGVAFDLEVALADTDRQLVANGITTAFHGLTISWEPGLRSQDNAARFVDAIHRLGGSLACDTHLHLRWETFALDAVDAVCDWLGRSSGAILAFNDHTTGSALMFEKRRAGTIDGAALSRKLGSWADRAGLGLEGYEDLIGRIWARRDEVPGAIQAVAARARAAGAVLLAHDEASPEERARFRALGAVSSEFPMNMETARAAREAGEHVIMGAPNVLRGGSHYGAMAAATAAGEGLCSVLASDYYYPAPLLAPFRLAADGVLDLASAWALVSANAAAAAGLADRGTLDPGRRGDVVVVEAAGRSVPRVVATFVAGRKVYEAA
ncbi:MAG: alpha-D-ribose 1-methylphosphonate 5-triphosphate diphosphatase [Alphaproteobacteria bacterium]